MRLPEQEAKRFIALYSAMIGWCSGRLDPKGKVRDVQAFLEAEMSDKADARDMVLDNATVIDEFVSENPHELGAEDLARIGAWKDFVRGDLVVERDLKRHTVFLDWKDDPTAYAVLSLTEDVVDLLPLAPPMIVGAVLLPWKGTIVCDGMLRFHMVHFGPGIRKSVKGAYREAKVKGVVASLEPGHEPSSQPKRAPKSKQSSSKVTTTRKRRAPDPSKAFVGRWRIVEMDAFEEDYVEIEGPAQMEIDKQRTGRFNFGLVSGEMDCRFSTVGEAPGLEFSWDGNDEHHPVMGRGRALIGEDGKMRGRIFIHHADDTGFVAEKVGARGKAKRK